MTDYDVVATGLKFPEGPIAMPDGSVVLVEIAAGRLSRVSPDGAIDVIAELGGGPNGAAIGPDGHCYVCNSGGFAWRDVDGLLFPAGAADDYSGGRIERVDLATGAHDVLYSECGGHRLNGPNDIVFDDNGGFWFTDTGTLGTRRIERGGLYYATPDGGRIDEVLYPLEYANGVSLSPDEDVVYYCETLNGRVWRCPLVAPGTPVAGLEPGNPGDLVYAPGGFLGFDSMAVDAAGNLCVATLFDGGISVISPRGELLDFHRFPDPVVTNICFGGEDLRTAYVTLSGSGRLVKMNWPRPGLALNFPHQ